MGIEGRISTIRKAVKNLAEGRAAEEFIEKPENKHIKGVFDTFKVLRLLSPKELEEAIKTNARQYNIKEEMGKEMSSVFYSVWNSARKDAEKKFQNAVDKMERTINFSSKEREQQMRQFSENYFEEIINYVKNDTRIIQKFTGKEYLLNKVIDFMISTMRSRNNESLAKYIENAKKGRWL